MSRVSIGLIAAAILAPTASQAQIQVGGPGDLSRYESMYGPPVEVSVDDLVQETAAYEGRAVRTKGRLDMDGLRTYTLRGVFAQSLRIAPVNEIASRFDDEARRLIGDTIEVTGVVQVSKQNASISGAFLQFWSFVTLESRNTKTVTGKLLTLEELVTKAARMDGRTVHVVGKFRGRNLYGDLPVKSALSSSDWVIKDELYAIWVTGRKPKGVGWALDASLKRDTGKWLDVVGTVETRGDVVYLHAKSLSLTEAPRVTAQALPPPPPKERPKVPPCLVFSLPLDGDLEVARDSRFVVQFSKDMDARSFGGHVGLRYVGPRRPGDREFDGLRISYDDGLRALTIDPGDQLRSGRELELLLLAGILDIDGLELIPRNGTSQNGVVDVLRYRINPY